MRRAWFKFYGQDFLTDPKMLALTSAQKVMWITLLCLVSTSEEEGVIKNITEERLKLLSGIHFHDQHTDEWKQTDETLKHFQDLKMIKVDGETIEVLNFTKRQSPQDSTDPDAVKERVKKHRSKFKSFRVTDSNDRREEKRRDKSREDNIYTTEFEEFWNSFPKKVGKGDAFNAWNKINPSKTLQAKMIKAIEEQGKSRQWKQGYIPNPSTWLNQGRWDDKLEPSKKMLKI